MAEFIEQKLNQEVEESTLFESLIAWKTRNDLDRATKATSTKDLQGSETTNEETPLRTYIVYVTYMLNAFMNVIIFLDNRVRRKSYASWDCLVGSGGMCWYFLFA